MRAFRIGYRVRALSFVLLLIFTVPDILAQEFQLAGQESSIKVFGTSSLHDWHIVAEQISGSISFQNLEEGIIDKCNVSILAESLKSGKNSMDKNTYKALKTSEHSKITFNLTQVKSINSSDKSTYNIVMKGDLSIAGTKKSIDLSLKTYINKEFIKLSGEKSIKMTDFNVEPPKALLGTITTGNEINIKFETIFK